ncbi:MAG TPA: ABC transporter substrate-binding protein, partial [Euzebya sp.]|nr:ABC transporter substrate-binding protein [Euzebya sp.]
MRMHSRWTMLVLMMALLALLATACRSGDDTTDLEDEEDPIVEDVATDADEPTDDEPTEEPEGDAEPTDDEGPTEDDAPAGDVVFDTGVTEEACPEAVNPDNGCIYLGTLSDLTVGPFAPLAVPITEAQAAFWDRVNQDGGIGGFDVNVSEYTRDNQYSPEVHSQQYEEIKPNVLALAQTLGSPTTFAILDDLDAENIVSAPASWTSAWLFSDVIVESGNTYCIESMNGLDYLTESGTEIGTVMAVHYPGDYGDDGAAGASHWAEANGAEFIDVPTVPGADNQGEAIGAITSQSPDVVVITTAPTEAGTIVGQAAAAGFTGRFLFSSPAFNPGLLQSPAAPA